MGNYLSSWFQSRSGADSAVADYVQPQIIYYSKNRNKEWDHQIRKMYRKSNDMRNVSSTLTNRVLDGDLKSPSEFVKQDDCEIVLLAHEDDLIGMVTIKPKESVPANKPGKHAGIHYLVVDSDNRREGHGFRLMLLAHNWIFSQGFINYVVECISTNVVATIFYKTLDFLEETYRLRKFSQTDQIHYVLLRFQPKKEFVGQDIFLYESGKPRNLLDSPTS